jgi:hypothetical protein
MNHDTRRITLVSRHPRMTERKWDRSAESPSRVVLLDSHTVLRYTVASTLVSIDADIERIILDRSSSASEYLALLAELPREFHGDVLMIRDDETGFLSSTGRGGDRILYALSSEDLRFYMQMHSLAETVAQAPAEATQQPKVIQFRPRVAVG